MAHHPHYWFDRRNLGQLLVPVTWQAFVLIGIQAILVALAALVIFSSLGDWATIGWISLIGLGLNMTFVVAIAKSPMPHWLRHSLGD
jgi:hypothetical protein